MVLLHGGPGGPLARTGGAPLAPLSQVPTLWSHKGFRALEQDVVPPALQTPPGLHKAPTAPGPVPAPGWARQPRQPLLQKDAGMEKQPQN